MSDLFNKASEIMGNFNPATDNVSDFEEIKDGTYECIIEEITARTSQSGNTYLSIKVSIMGDAFNGRLMFVPKYFSEKTIERSIKECIKLMDEYGYELPIEMFEDMDTLASGMDNAIAGSQIIVKKSTSKNDFTNYTLTAVSN